MFTSHCNIEFPIYSAQKPKLFTITGHEQINKLSRDDFADLIKRKCFQIIDNHNTASATLAAITMQAQQDVTQAVATIQGLTHQLTTKDLPTADKEAINKAIDKAKLLLSDASKRAIEATQATNTNNRALSDSLSKMGVFAIPSPDIDQHPTLPNNSDLKVLSRLELIREVSRINVRQRKYLDGLGDGEVVN